jgi:hypothetical protein
MILVAMLAKVAAWIFAFYTGSNAGAQGMLARAAAVALLLTLADKVSVAANLPWYPALPLTLLLYALMSFTLFPIAWKVRSTGLSLSLCFFGTLGAFAGVNFTMDFLRGLLPL